MVICHSRGLLSGYHEVRQTFALFFTTLRLDISSRIMRRQSGILPEDVEPPIWYTQESLPLSILYAVHARLSYSGIAVIGEFNHLFVGYCVSDYARA